jgi:hypothetical protein
MRNSEIKEKKKDNRGGFRDGSGRPGKFGKDVKTTTISVRVPVQYESEVKERMDEIVNELAYRISNDEELIQSILR